MFVILALVISVFPAATAYETREELRAAYHAAGALPEASPYAQEPCVSAPYASGALTEAALDDALAYLNFLRALAGLEAVGRSRIYDARCQNGATLLAALDIADHNPPCPEDMDPGFYESARLAASSSNLAKFNWMRPAILREGVAYFARDDGEANLPVLGHRRWLLNPAMADTGFGLANSDTGMSYVVMYAHDFGNADAAWDAVMWPSAGAFPVELMRRDLAWSVSLNPQLYDLAQSDVRVTLTEERSGLSFAFECSAGRGDGFCCVSMDNYGSGPCVIFRPDFGDTDFVEYQQNQRWTVKLTGLKSVSGEARELIYTAEMASLYVQDVANIEMSQLEARLKPGETLRLSAAVVPDYADDLSLRWSSSDESVAVTDAYGTVTAVGTGVCEIRAESANGRYDYCEITVSG